MHRRLPLHEAKARVGTRNHVIRFAYAPLAVRCAISPNSRSWPRCSRGRAMESNSRVRRNAWRCTTNVSGNAKACCGPPRSSSCWVSGQVAPISVGANSPRTNPPKYGPLLWTKEGALPKPRWWRPAEEEGQPHHDDQRATMNVGDGSNPGLPSINHRYAEPSLIAFLGR